MTDIAAKAYELLRAGEPVVLAKITSQQGSTPRTAGTQMVVTRGGEIFGTIGGGLLEAKVSGQCIELMADGKACFETFDLGHEEVAGMDMICGGDLEILLDPFAPTAEHIALFERWSRMTAEGREGSLVFVIRRSNGAIEGIDHALIESNGRIHGHLTLPPAVMASLTRAARMADAMVTMNVEDRHVILEPIRKPKTAFIVGAGHVAQPTAHLAALVGFRVVVLDDRSSFANRTRFPDAHEVRVLPDFQDPFAGLSVDEDGFIIIVTRGHLYDKIVLARALQTPAGYIGMIGSRRKRDAIFKGLSDEGFSEADLRRVRSPVGLDIDAETPAEIAVSIVGEMIAAKRKKMKAVASAGAP